MWRLTVIWIALALSACTGMPANVEPVGNFELSRYLGTWYEIARMDHSFERGLTRVSAEYSMRQDGGVKVINRGYNAEDDRWKEAEGRAYFVGASDTGHLKVSFFGPFFASYVVVELDTEGYEYALVAGYNRDYLWILSRTPQLPKETVNRLVARARQLGFATEELMYIEQ